MKGFSIRIAIPIFLGMILGVASFFTAWYYVTPLVAAEMSTIIIVQETGWRPMEGCILIGEQLMQGSTAFVYDLPDKENREVDLFFIQYETASDIWRWVTVDCSLMDSDGDGYKEWISVTLTGGATAGGKVRLFGMHVDGLP